MGKLADRVALVTGGASGLGRACAERFAREGATVIVADLDEAGGAAVAASLGHGATFHTLDVAEEPSWAALFSDLENRHGRLDYLVSSAGITTVGTVEELSVAAWDRTFAINVRGTFLGCRFAIGLMKRGGGGAIVNIGSVSGFKAMPELVAYNGSKAAVNLMTESMALHCAKEKLNIRVNSINPGVIRTAMLEKVMAQAPNPQALMQGYFDMHPIGRIGQPEEIASMALYLVSDEAGFITGAHFTVDGGLGL